MIEVRDLDFRYPRSEFRLRIEALSIARGESVAFVGPSGSGKTTLLNLLAGILVPASGTVRVGKTTLGTLSDAERRRFRVCEVGFVFQTFELIDYLTVLENVLVPRLINPAMALSAAARSRARQLLTEVGLAGKESRSVLQLSQGERQRVAIARAMLNQPRYLFADEPTGNLDPANKSHLVDLLHQQCGQTGATLIMVTHDLAVLGGCRRVIDFGSFLRREWEAS